MGVQVDQTRYGNNVLAKQYALISSPVHTHIQLCQGLDARFGQLLPSRKCPLSHLCHLLPLLRNGLKLRVIGPGPKESNGNRHNGHRQPYRHKHAIDAVMLEHHRNQKRRQHRA